MQEDRILKLCITITSTAGTLLIMPYRRKQKLQVTKEPPVSGALQPTLQQPLSLQQASILCVISNLESFPPDMLALLPLKFRRDLLRILPPADVFQLEQTTVVDGIDMENEVWKVVYERYDYEVARTAHIDPDKPDLRKFYLRHRRDVSRFPKAVESRKEVVSSSAPLTWKASFLSCIFAFLLHMRPLQINTELTNFCKIYSSSTAERNYIVFLQLLFCTQFFTFKQIKSLGGFPLKVFGVTIHLSRYRQFFFPKNEPFQVPDWIHFLLVKCHLEAPCSITVDEQHFSWDVASESHNVAIFRNFCRKIKNVKLHLYCKYPPKGVPIPQIDAAIHKLSQFFVTILSCHQDGVPRLESVDIDEHVATFRADSVKWHGRDNHMFNSMLQRLFLHPVLPIQGLPSIIHQFHTLKHVRICGFKTEIEMSTICSLLVILQNQPLETLLVSGPQVVGNEVQHAHLQQALWTNFSSPISPTCTSITLNCVYELPLSFLLWLIQKFLYSPSNGPQTLTLTDLKLNYSIVPDENNLKCTPASSCLALPHKSLHISQLRSELNVKPALIKALSYLPSVVLDSLQFSSCWKHEVKPGPMDILDAFFNTDSTRKIKCLLCRFRRGRFGYVDKPKDSQQIVNIFTIAQKLPETAVTLECETTLHYMQDLFDYLHTAWKNSGGKTLDNLLIRFDKTDPYCKPHFQSLLESAISTHSINMIAKTVEVSVEKQICYSNVS